MNTLAQPHLFSSLKLGALDLRHRIFLSCPPESLAPEVDGPAVSPAVDFYASRSTPGGLVLCSIAPGQPAGEGHLVRLGLQTAGQVNRWRSVTDAIHDRGGLAIARIGDGPRIGATWPDADEVDDALESFRTAAENAGDAGFDGLELAETQGSGDTPGYTDFLCGVVDTLCVVWPDGRIGLGMSLRDGARHLDAASRLLGSLGSTAIAYTHLAPVGVRKELVFEADSSALRSRFPGAILLSGEWNVHDADAAIRRGEVDAVGPHRAFWSDANLPQSWQAALGGNRS